jgi:phosphatidylinositol alpha-1,6-mannosyltransferase
VTRRYLVVTELFLPTKGGTAVWFDEVYRRLGDRSTHIVTARVPGCEDHDRNHANTVHRLALQRHPWLRPESLFMYLKLLGKTLHLAFRHRFDAVHAGRVLPEGAVALAAARMRGLPCVIYAHGEEITTWTQPLKSRAMRATYRLADRVIANSEFTRGELLRIGVPAGRITLINPGVDIRRFRPGLPCEDLRHAIGLTERQRLVLSVGRLSRRKGFDTVIRSLPLLRAQGLDVRYAVIGVGEDRDYLLALARETGVAERVYLLGHVSPDDLPRWYNACDVFVMANREINGDNEGFGIVFLEAAACGKPVIAGQAGGTGAAVEDGVTGLRVDGNALDQVTHAIATILRNPGTAKTMGERASGRASRQFSWESVVRRTREACA